MPKYDAFGREIGEDTPAGLGSGIEAEPVRAEPVPAESLSGRAEPASGPTAPAFDPVARPMSAGSAPAGSAREPLTFTLSGPRPRRRIRRRGIAVLVLICLAVVVAPILIGAVAVFNAVDEVSDGVRGGIRSIPDAADAP